MAEDTELMEEPDYKAMYETLKEEHEALKVQVGLSKMAYKWKEGDSKCSAVPQDGECPECGWGSAEKGRSEPHPVL